MPGPYEYLRPVVNVPRNASGVALTYNPNTGLHDGHIFDTTWITRAYLLTATTVKTVKASGGDYTLAQLQTALNDAGTANDFRVIVVDSGSICNVATALTMPSKSTGTAWTFVVSSNWWSGAWAPTGQRYVNLDTETANLFRIQHTGTNDYVVSATTTAQSRFGMIGVHVRRTVLNTTQQSYPLVGVYYPVATSIAQLPSEHVMLWSWIDGIWDLGGVNYPTLRGIEADGYKFAFRNSCVTGIAAAQDNQAAWLDSGAGIFYGEDSLLEAGCENVMLGGGQANANFMLSDILFRRCYFPKRMSWNAASPTYKSAFVSPSAKNSFEVKHGRRVLLEACVFEHSPAGGQEGFGVLVKSVNQTDHASPTDTQHVCVRLSKVLNTNTPLALSLLEMPAGSTNIATTQPATNIEFTGNLCVSGIQSQLNGLKQRAMLIGNSFGAVTGKVYGPVTTRWNTFGARDPYGFTHRVIEISTAVLSTHAGGVSPLDNNVFDFPGSYGVDLTSTAISAAAFTAAGVTPSGNAMVESAVGGWLRRADFQAPFPAQYTAGLWELNGSSTFPTTARPTGRFTDWVRNDWSVNSAATFRGLAAGGLDPGYDKALVDSVTSGVANAPSFIPVTVMPTTYASAVRIDDRFDRVDFGAPVAFDLGSAMTVGFLVFVPAVPVDAMLVSRDSGTAGWNMFLNGSSGIDMIFRGVTTNDYSRFNNALTLGAWNWVFAKWDGTAWALRSGVYGAALANTTRNGLSALTGGMTSTVGRLLRIGFSEGGTNAATITRDAFLGIWNTVLADATVDAYAADMLANAGGASTSVEYWKWAATDTASITGGKSGIVGTYSGIAAADIITGPDGSGTGKRSPAAWIAAHFGHA